MAQINAVADSDLNEWIHEKMLGYTRDFLQNNVPNIKVWIGDTPDYCGSIDNALMIVESMREIGILFSMVNTLEGDWTVSALQWNPEQNSWQLVNTVTDSLLSRAICQTVATLIPDES
jgi:hypothetical protein